jgi:hypothetical protein
MDTTDTGPSGDQPEGSQRRRDVHDSGSTEAWIR